MSRHYHSSWWLLVPLCRRVHRLLLLVRSPSPESATNKHGHHAVASSNRIGGNMANLKESKYRGYNFDAREGTRDKKFVSPQPGRGCRCCCCCCRTTTTTDLPSRCAPSPTYSQSLPALGRSRFAQQQLRPIVKSPGGTFRINLRPLLTPLINICCMETRTRAILCASAIQMSAKFVEDTNKKNHYDGTPKRPSRTAYTYTW
jgi:hypothetical protein